MRGLENLLHVPFSKSFMKLVKEARWRTLHNIVDIVGGSYGAVHLTSKPNMKRAAAKFVSRLVIPQQEDHRVQVCKDLRATEGPKHELRAARPPPEVP